VELLEEVDSFNLVQTGYAKDLDKFADLIDVIVTNVMESSGDDGLGYGSLYFKLLKKLPEPLIRDYQR